MLMPGVVQVAVVFKRKLNLSSDNDALNVFTLNVFSVN